MTLCTGDLGTPQRKSSDMRANIRSAFQISTFQLRIVFAPDALSENERRATKPFELVHSDLKSFLVTSYRKFKYIITFYNDFTSHAWTMALHSKAAAITATKDFLEIVTSVLKYTHRLD